jgi:hypothetical protein
VFTFLLFLLLFFLCWPLALLALILYPIVRLIGIAVGGALALVWMVVTLPVRLIARVV